MIEKDTIQELFSKAFENHTAPVNPELWAGVQAKMSAAGVAGAGGAAAKGLSALAKWAIGSAALTSAAVVTTVIVMNSGEEPKSIAQQQTGNTPVIEQTTPEAPLQATQNQQVEQTHTNTATPQQIEVESPRVFRREMAALDYFLNDSFVNKEGAEMNGNTQSGELSAKGAETNGATTNEAPAGSSVNNGSTSEESSAGASVQKDPEVAPAKLELPNVFTPNGDGANDLFKFNKAENIQSIEVIILDGNGREVFKSNEIDFGWNGTIFNGGDQAPEGIYTCQVLYRDMANGMKTKTSYIYLKR